MNHTPGPWKTYIHPAIKRGGCAITARGQRKNSDAFRDWPVAYTNGWNPANASLIAAAPDLLEALQTLVDESMCNYDVSIMSWKTATDAINKALGE